MLPGIGVSLVETRPDAKTEQGTSLAATLRRARKERGLLQREAAALIGVSEYTLLNWEKGKQPTDRQFPAIAFLGFEPWTVPETLEDRLVAARRRRGLAAKRAAVELEVDESTYLSWDAGWHLPSKRNLERVEAFIAS